MKIVEKVVANWNTSPNNWNINLLNGPSIGSGRGSEAVWHERVFLFIEMKYWNNNLAL